MKLPASLTPPLGDRPPGGSHVPHPTSNPLTLVKPAGKDAPVPQHPYQGQSWKEVRHDNGVTWLAYWRDTVNPKEFKCGAVRVCVHVRMHMLMCVCVYVCVCALFRLRVCEPVKGQMPTAGCVGRDVRGAPVNLLPPCRSPSLSPVQPSRAPSQACMRLWARANAHTHTRTSATHAHTRIHIFTYTHAHMRTRTRTAPTNPPSPPHPPPGTCG
jgi:hypothetical protein